MAESGIHEEHQPLLALPTENITRIVAIAMDTSGYSEYTLHWAVENYLRPESDFVILLHARSIPSVSAPFGSAYVDFTDYLDRVDQYNRQESHALLRSAGQYLKDHKIIWKALALRGDAGDLITQKVSEYKADVLIMGSRGMGMLKRAFIGSVSDYCLHHSVCPVLIVKHPHPEELEQYHSALRRQ